MAGTAMTLAACAVVTAARAVIPESTVAGALVSVIRTAYVTTLDPPAAVAAVGVIWLTTPSIGVEPAAATVTEVGWPTFSLLMSLSAKLAVTCIGPTSSVIALPDGASTPATTPTDATTPSAGAVSVAAATWILACRTDSWALTMLAWSDAMTEAVAGAVLLEYASCADWSPRLAEDSWAAAELADVCAWSLSDATWLVALVTAFWSDLISVLGGPAAWSAARVACAWASAAWAWLSLSAFCWSVIEETVPVPESWAFSVASLACAAATALATAAWALVVALEIADCALAMATWSAAIAVEPALLAVSRASLAFASISACCSCWDTGW